jgi:hypothetical protein
LESWALVYFWPLCPLRPTIRLRRSSTATSKPITLKGKITRMLWSNPHGHLYIEVAGPDGKPVEWEIEFGGPSALYRRGWRKTDLPVGAEVTVQGFLAKDGSPTANANTVKLPDGRSLFAGSAGTGAPYEASEGGR